MVWELGSGFEALKFGIWVQCQSGQFVYLCTKKKCCLGLGLQANCLTLKAVDSSYCSNLGNQHKPNQNNNREN